MGRVGKPDSEAQVAAYQRILERVADQLTKRDELNGLASQVVIWAFELDNNKVDVRFAPSREEALRLAEELDPDLPAYLAKRMKDLEANEVPAVVVLRAGGIFYHPLIRVDPSHLGNA